MLYKNHFEIFMQKLLENLPDEVAESDFSEFKKELDEKMIKGHNEHGDGVFDRKLSEILKEITFEAIDLTGWSLVAEVVAKNDSNISEDIKKEIMDIAIDGFSNWLRLKKIINKIN